MSDCRARRDPLLDLEGWLDSALGRDLAHREAECLERMLCDTFGYYLLQLGGVQGLGEAVAASRIRHRILIPATPRLHPRGGQIVALPTHLPVASDSVDAVLLPHTLDFAADPRLVLREAERVLIPEGRLIVIGFNALSPWGLRGLVGPGRRRIPWCGRFLTSLRVADWLSVLGFDLEMRETMMFRPPWRPGLSPRLSFVEPLGKRFWPLFGGVYAMRAVKRVVTLTALRPSWKRRRPLLAGGAVEPTPRGNRRG